MKNAPRRSIAPFSKVWGRLATQSGAEVARSTEFVVEIAAARRGAGAAINARLATVSGISEADERMG